VNGSGVNDPRANHPRANAPRVKRRHRVAPWVVLGVVVVLVPFVVILATSDASTDRQVDTPLAGKAAPDLAGPIIVGTGNGVASGEFDLSASRGRWVVVNFFATWCVPCQREHPELVRWSRAHAQAGDADLVSVVFDDTGDDVAAYFAEHGGEWPVVDDPGAATAVDWGVIKVPESYLVDPDGIVVAKIVGGVTSEGLDEILARAKAAEGRA